MKEPILGVIGGMGPDATTHFMELVTAMTDAGTDQGHVNMIVYNFPSIPDRTGYILGYNLKSPLPGLTHVGHALARQGASCIAVPCVTAHYFHQELQAALPVPVLNAVRETLRLLQQQGICRVGIMATEGTIRSGFLSRELDEGGITSIIPSPARQEDVNHLIYENVKAGRPPDMERFFRVQQELRDCGAEIVLLGCTELSLIRREGEAGFLDMLEVLARESVLRCGKHLRPEYENLLKGETYAAKYSGISGAYPGACAG